MGERTGATVRLAAWCATVVAMGRLLVAAGDGELAVPLTSLPALEAWVDRTPPPEMAIAVLRLAGLSACAYLLAVTALGVVARGLRLRPLAGAVDRVTPRLVRRLVAGGSGAGLVLGTVVGALPVPDLALRPPGATVAAAPGSDARVLAGATMSRVDRPDEAAGPTATAAGNPNGARNPAGAPAAAGAHPGDPARARADDTPALPSEPKAAEATMTRVAPVPRSAAMHRLDGPRLDATAGPPARTPVPGGAPTPTSPPASPPPTPSAATAPSAPAAPPAPTAPVPALPSVDPGTWVVEPGDSLWSIAAEVVHADEGAPGEAGLAAYWRALVAENRVRLVDPDNPDLLLPGQRLHLPPATR